MAGATMANPARGNALRTIAITPAAIYTLFTVVFAFGGTDVSYQALLWTSSVLLMLVAAGTFAIGAVIHRTAESSMAGASDHRPVLTSVS